MKIKITGIFLFIIAVVVCNGQNNIGVPFIKNYTPSDYNYHSQNWCFAQDDRGMIFIGNGNGIIEYDGSSWRVLNSGVCRALEKSPDGRLFYGGQGKFGYLEADSTGSFREVPLQDKLRTKDAGFEIRDIIFNGEDVIFNGLNKLFILNDNEVRVIEHGQITTKLFKNSLNIFVYVKDQGIGVFSNDKIKSVDNGFFAGMPVYSFFQIGNDEYLVGTKNNGLFRFNSKTGKAEQFNTSLNSYFVEKGIYDGLKINNDKYVIGTDYGGVVIINGKGELVNLFNKSTGLHDEIVNNLALDNSGNLWILLNNGFSRIDMNSAVSHFGEKNGLYGLVTSIVRHNGKIYASTMQGLYRLDVSESVMHNEQSHYYFRKVEGIIDGVMSMSVINGRLYAGARSGVFEVFPSGAVRNIVEMENLRYFEQSKADPDWIVTSSREGISLLKVQGNNMKFIGTFDAIPHEVVFFIQDKEGNVWATRTDSSLVRIRLSDTVGLSAPYDVYNSKHGLPQLQLGGAVLINGNVYVSSEKGVFRFNEESTREKTGNLFIKDKKMSELMAKNNFQSVTVKIQNSQLMHIGNNTVELLGYRKNDFFLDSLPFKIIPRSSQVFSIYGDTVNKLFWFGGSEGLYCFDPSVKKNYDKNFPVLVRKVTMGKDSVIFWGTMNNKFILNPEIDYEFNTLSFEFSGLFYEQESELEYQFYLEGFSDEWSEWSKKNTAEFTNLYEGEYVFKVKARNVYGVESNIAEFKFTVNPPLKRTPLAITLYIIVGFLLILLIARLYTKRLKANNKKLERMIKDRTAEVQQQKEELQAANEQLIEINSELEKLSIVARETDNSILIMDADGNFEWVNDAFTKLYGYTLEEFKKERGTNIKGTSSSDQILDIFNRCIHTKKSVSYSSRFQTKSKKIWLQSTLTPVLDDKGNVKRIVIIESDIDKLKLAEEEVLRQKEEILSQRDQLESANVELEKLSVVARETDNAIMVLDANANILWINESLTRLFGYTFETYIQNKGSNLMQSSANPNIAEVWAKCINEKKSIHYESMAKTIHGRLWTQTTLTPILDKDGKVTKVISIDSDISKLKSAEEEILQQKEEIQSQKDMLELAKEDLEKSHKLITDSIIYAKKIQESILPSNEEIKTDIPDSFVFFKPRDIVSGDFYWYHRAENKIFFAVADCTGHGVPGAFMSMIGNTLLNQIVKEKKKYKPSTILETLNKQVVMALKQNDRSESSQDDGMDVSIVCIDLDAQKIHIASANHTVLVVSKERTNSIKGDIFSIGGFFSSADEVSFTNHTIQLTDDSVIYLFTDGFQDQFGGSLNQKYMTARFEELLIDISSKPMDEQKLILEKQFSDWKGDSRQIDDILVVGLRTRF